MGRILNQPNRISTRTSCSYAWRWLAEIMRNNGPSCWGYSMWLPEPHSNPQEKEETWKHNVWPAYSMKSAACLKSSSEDLLLGLNDKHQVTSSSLQCPKWSPSRELTIGWHPVPAGDTGGNKSEGAEEVRRRGINGRRGEKTLRSEDSPTKRPPSSN